MWSGEIKLNQGKKIIVGVIKMTGTTVVLYEPDVTTKTKKKRAQMISQAHVVTSQLMNRCYIFLN